MIFFPLHRKGSTALSFPASYPSPHLSKKYHEWLSPAVVDVLCSDVGYSSKPSDVV